MQPLPHHYNVTVTGDPEPGTEITSPGLDPLISAPPREFDGPGNLWSPETLTVAAVADCLVLTFRAIASVARLRWTKIVCDGIGTVDRFEGVPRLTEVRLHARLDIPDEAEQEKAHRLLEKAEKACLIGNSLRFPPTLEVEVVAPHEENTVELTS